MKSVTLDTNLLNKPRLYEEAEARGYQLAIVSVTRREVEGSDISTIDFEVVLETGRWGESRWGESVFPARPSDLKADDILQVISNGSFKGGKSLTAGERRQLRDAMILEAHCRAGREIFVSNDRRAFLKEQVRMKLQDLCRTTILSESEFQALLDKT